MGGKSSEITAGVLELADEEDSKSFAGDSVWVRVPLTACRQMEKKRRDAGSTNRDLKLLFCRAASLFGILLFGGVN